MTSIVDAPLSDLDGRPAAGALIPFWEMKDAGARAAWAVSGVCRLQAEPRRSGATRGQRRHPSRGDEGGAAWDHAAKFNASRSRSRDPLAMCESLGACHAALPV